MWEKFTALWREARFQGKTVKTPHAHARTTLEFRMWKKYMRSWCGAHFEVKTLKKTHMFGPLLDIKPHHATPQQRRRQQQLLQLLHQLQLQQVQQQLQLQLQFNYYNSTTLQYYSYSPLHHFTLLIQYN